jgi:hypothetical protein
MTGTLTTLLPNDGRGRPIQVVPHLAQGGHGVAASAGAAKLIGPFGPATRIVTVRAVGGGVFWVAGDATVVATAPAVPFDNGPHYLGDGQSVDVVLGGDVGAAAPRADHLSVIAAGAGTPAVYVSERA